MPSQRSAALNPAEPFRLGEWVVHPDRNLLVRGGRERRLEARTMDVLVRLAARPGELVRKQELLDAVWQTEFVSDNTLTKRVAELREALGDDARDPRYIETIPKRGYRLVATLGNGAAATEARGASQRWPRRRRVLALAAAAIFSLAGVVAIVALRGSTTLDAERVLVLPPTNRSGDPGADELALMTRDCMVQVAMDAGLALMVAGPDPAATQEEAVRMGRVARAGVVVTGSIYLRDGELVVETQLLDDAAGELLYAVPPVVVAEGSSAAAVTALGDRTLGALATHLRAHAHARLLSHAPTLAAYREFMAGSETFGTDYEDAFLHLRRAVEIDPAYTSAWIRLAVGYLNTGRHTDADAIFARLDAERQRLTPFERLNLDFFAQRDTSPEQAYGAIRELDRMVPHDLVFTFLGGVQALSLNRPRETLQWVGLRARPVPPWIARSVVAAGGHSVRALALHMLGAFDAELTAAREGVRRYPGVMPLRSAEIRALAAMGDREGVEALIAEALATAPRVGSAGWVILDGAAAARAHGHPALAADLASRAATWFDDADERFRGIPFGLVVALFHVGGSGLARARGLLEEGVAGLPDETGDAFLAAFGWLGVVAARQGDVQRASDLDVRLASVQERRARGLALFYRACIAAWRGDHGAAADRFREALAAGWGSFDSLHDRERILIEPVAGDPYFAAVLYPEH